jgi:hypothetical protein
MKCFQRVHQFWLEQRRGPRRNQEPDESTLARQFARHRIQDLSDPKYAATREKLAEIEKKEADARDWELADAPVAATEQRMQAEHDAWCRGQRRDPEPRPLLRREAGKHAYPGLLNLGQTCYLGSVIQCLIHCGAARAVLQDQPAAAPQDGVATLPLALQSLAAECVHGVSLPADAGLRPDFRAGVDLYSPHAVIDVFADVSGFVVGSNYDACEALQLLFQNMAPLSDIFHASSALTVENIVCLPPFSDSGDDFGGLSPFIANDLTKTVDMKTLLAVALSGDNGLSSKPPHLAVRIPQFWDAGVEHGRTRFWLTTNERGDDGFCANWGDDGVGLTLDVRGVGVVYHLRAYVEYTGMSELDEPTVVLRHPAGHFVAHFYDEESGWYSANDSVVARKEDAAPHPFPYIYFFEREDSRRHYAAQLPWKPAVTIMGAPDVGDDADSGQSSDVVGGGGRGVEETMPCRRQCHCAEEACCRCHEAEEASRRAYAAPPAARRSQTCP